VQLEAALVQVVAELVAAANDTITHATRAKRCLQVGDFVLPVIQFFNEASMRRRLFHWFFVGVVSLFVFATTPQPAHAASRSVVRKYWDGFRDYWGRAMKNQSGITMVVLATGAVAMFIITRVKGNR
jgi:hypothetical protein